MRSRRSGSAIATETIGSTTVQPGEQDDDGGDDHAPASRADRRRTWRKAASTFRLSALGSQEDRGAEMRSRRGRRARRPTSSRPRISGGSLNARRLPDDPAADRTSVSPLTNAARISARWKPKLRRGRGGLRGERQRDERESDRERVGQHVPRVREQGEAVREEAADDLDHGEADGEHEHEERAAGRARWSWAACRGGGRRGSQAEDRRRVCGSRSRVVLSRLTPVVRRVPTMAAWPRSSSSSVAANAERRPAAGSGGARDVAPSARSSRSCTGATGSRPAGGAGPRASRRRRTSRRRHGSRRASPSSTASSAAASSPRRSSSSAASRASASRRCCSPPSARSRGAGATHCSSPGEESVAQVRLRADRLGGADDV